MAIDLCRDKAVVIKSKFLEEKRFAKENIVRVCAYNLKRVLGAEAVGLQAEARDSQESAGERGASEDL